MAVLFPLTDEVVAFEVLPRLWNAPSERYAVYSFGFVNRASYALVLACLRDWTRTTSTLSGKPSLTSWALFKALVHGRQYALLENVFTAFRKSPADILKAFGVSASPLTLQGYGKAMVSLRPFAHFRLDWPTLRGRSLQRLTELLAEAVLVHDDPSVLQEFETAYKGRIGPRTFSEAVVDWGCKCPNVFKKFIDEGACTPINAFLSDQMDPVMWEVALKSGKISIPEAFKFACDTSRFHLMAYMWHTTPSYYRKDLVIQSLQTQNNVAAFGCVWDLCCAGVGGGDLGAGVGVGQLSMFLDAWEAIAFADLPSAILQKVGERYNQVSEYWVAIHLIASVRFIPLLEFLDEVRIRALISQVLFGKCYAYFDAMVALGREDVTRWLYHAVISTGNVPMFLKYAHDTFASYKVDTGDLVETLVYGKPEIMAILLQRASFEVWPNLLRYAQRILAEAGTGKHKARKVETARLVVARADASQRHTLSWASSSSSSSSF
jgi:hypothetical protein